jgi:ubiquinone/menaquinone biosynthesis C-methylase UbiE
LEAASLLKRSISASSTILDAGCGTGLVGAALGHVGFMGDIDGIDLSPVSLEKAGERGVYRNLRPADFQALPLALADDAYDALTCVGVLTYVPDSDAILREFARIVRPGGVAVVTQRDDLFEERAFDRTIQQLVDAQVFSDATVTEPKLYLPANPDFGSSIQVIYAMLTVA